MLKLHLTCSACPEQYDVYHEGKVIGYLRLRHGYFRADYPNCGGETVYTAETEGDGSFLDNERQLHLTAACESLLRAANIPFSNLTSESLYEIVSEVPSA